MLTLIFVLAAIAIVAGLPALTWRRKWPARPVSNEAPGAQDTGARVAAALESATPYMPGAAASPARRRTGGSA